jgi:hypothetical protein
LITVQLSSKFSLNIKKDIKWVKVSELRQSDLSFSTKFPGFISLRDQYPVFYNFKCDPALI